MATTTTPLLKPADARARPGRVKLLNVEVDDTTMDEIVDSFREGCC